MQRTRRAAPFEAALAIPVVYRAGEHTLSISFVAEGRWTVSLDGGPSSRTFGSQVEAWEEGVRAADAQDRPRPA
jgi:hypothetical protein